MPTLLTDHMPLKMRRDKAQKAADNILKNLMDRRGIKQELQICCYEDKETWREIRMTLAQIIREKFE